MSGKRIPADELEAFVTDIFHAMGVSERDARITAEVLVATDMRGIASHGVVRVARYIECLRSGGLRPDAVAEVSAEHPAMIRIDAHNGMGIPASVAAVRQIIHKAAKQPVVWGTVRRSDHYGAAGVYALMFADAGLFGFSMSNTCPLMSAPGGASAAIGNNPFSYAAPAGKYRAILFDICMSVVASGKIEIAAAEGNPIPEGWLLDSKGKPTADPAERLRGGVLLPFGGHKGYGLAMMVEILAGALAGAGMLGDVHSWNSRPDDESDTGHCFMALNPGYFGGLDSFVRRVEGMVESLRSGPRASGIDHIYYPGEMEFEREKDARENGVPLGEASLGELRRAAEIVGILRTV